MKIMPVATAVPWANARYVDTSYFPLLGIALRQGQLFGDDENAPGGRRWDRKPSRCW